MEYINLCGSRYSYIFRRIVSNGGREENASRNKDKR